MSDDVDVKALIAEARERFSHASGYVAMRELAIRLAAALEAVSARPLVADREAVRRALVSVDSAVFDQPNAREQYDELTDAVMRVIQSKGDAQAEALEEAAGHVRRLIEAEKSVAPDGATQHAMQGYVLTELEVLFDTLMARAAAYRTPASPTGRDSRQVAPASPVSGVSNE